MIERTTRNSYLVPVRLCAASAHTSGVRFAEGVFGAGQSPQASPFRSVRVASHSLPAMRQDQILAVLDSLKKKFSKVSDSAMHAFHEVDKDKNGSARSTLFARDVESKVAT